MERSHPSVVEREQLLDEIATAYLKALEQGLAPDRREWLGRHPELAAELEEFFAEQDRLEKLAAPLRACATDALRHRAARVYPKRMYSVRV